MLWKHKSFFPPHDACPILEQTSPQADALSAASLWSSSSVKSLLSSCVCRPVCLHSGFKQPILQKDVYVAWNRATKRLAFAQNVYMTHSSRFHSCSCAVGKDSEETRRVNLSGSHASGSHISNLSYLSDTPDEQGTLTFRLPHSHLFFMMMRNMITSQGALSGVSQNGFIQKPSHAK